MRENFDSRALDRITMEKAYKKSVEIIERDRIKESDSNYYSQEEIDGDIEEIKRLKEKFGESDEMKKAADLFEAIIYEQAELQNWLGPKAETILPSEYDDIKNGVDCLVEFSSEDGAKHLALAIDVTFSSDPSVLGGKIEKIQDEIERGDLTEVKYFPPVEQGADPGLRRLPRVVVGADFPTIKDLAELWLSKDNPAMEKHHIGDLILEEVRMQLKRFEAYARDELGNEDVADAYKERLEIINEIINSKQNIDVNRLREDGTFRALERMLA